MDKLWFVFVEVLRQQMMKLKTFYAIVEFLALGDQFIIILFFIYWVFYPPNWKKISQHLHVIPSLVWFIDTTEHINQVEIYEAYTNQNL